MEGSPQIDKSPLRDCASSLAIQQLHHLGRASGKLFAFAPSHSMQFI
ncbi:Uncharacterised protein [Vibrio cholerae]|nr:Uncharacterised protein [Vibrio cholerae]